MRFHALRTAAHKAGLGCSLAFTAMVALAEADSFEESVRPAFEQNCIRCHGEKGKVKGKVNLLELGTAAELAKRPDLLKDLVDVLRDAEMPPEDEPPLDPQAREQLVAHLQEMLRSAIARNKAFAPTPIRRMNRFQYNNAVQDLFELKVEVFPLPERMAREYGNYFQPATRKMPQQLKVGSRPLGKSQMIEPRLAGVAAFPQDLRAEHGFDNRADHLSLSPLLLESFMKLSRSIVESKDFNAKTCGSWPRLFAPPGAGETTPVMVRARLRDFLGRAFRRPVGDDLLTRYTRHVMSQIESGKPFAEAMKSAASAAIASPRFLYLYDRADGGGDFDLASRLSFFLWGSIPDQGLLDAAAAGDLRDPQVLGAQVDRMLDDDRLKRFCDSFPSQWLQLERIISSAPDPQRFPEFYFAKYRSSMHMMLEPLLLFETVLVEDRPILELIDPQFSYRSDLLQSWYRDGNRGKNSPPVALPFKRVAVSDRRQGGVITNAAVMTMTSGASRTQPITRGAWIASVIFNDPPEPPPADVPPLAEDESAEEKSLTLRERLTAHRERASCAGCHEQIDPLGFALENFGPTGLWRDTYENGRPVDPRGVLFRKHEFADVLGFKDAILAEKDRFARAFTGHLLSFALGREVGTNDSIAIEEIVERSAADEYRFRSLIKEIVLSQPFLYQTAKTK